MNNSAISILGGGPAGLAVGYFARKQQLPFQIFEAGARTGGNCVTVKHGDFRFDSGAHRFHDKSGEITDEFLRLMGKEMKKIHVPSQIYHQGAFIDFPLTPLDLFKKLGAKTFLKAALKLGVSRFLPTNKDGSNFRDIALSSYGPVIAEKFLLDYSKKLWGTETSDLSPEVAGKRLNGLDLRTFLVEALFGRQAKTTHVDGSFYYPEQGIGQMMERLVEFCGKDHIAVNSRITKVFHDNGQIHSIEINHKEQLSVDRVVSTLPISLLIQLMDPLPPQEILNVARQLRFQHLLLVAFFLDKPKVSGNASIYFPDKEFLFTRIVEPSRRSEKLSPKGKTSLVCEIPCPENSTLWKEDENELIGKVKKQLLSTKLIRDDEIIGQTTYPIPFAYPVLDIRYKERVSELMNYLNSFKNLHLSGRNGRFQYSHIHDQMQFGKDIVEGLVSK
ncbi:FAD-dependent oxidoreductase [Xanthovirga aplysinae]|uniref:FAD-dependent oxidoreductase n=1 Tax=Xanthovirga aplysinae TaxID=2529853 RepID=UPI0012BBC4CD|nr:FAD-dependent oxidoreductase [Xanthovirga aplysinae]MTI33504.1 amine oxidase [Xanthovirga aplysinae]